MRLLLDTHYLLWSTIWPRHLSLNARRILLNPENQLYFSAANIWEIGVKRSLDRPDFRVNPETVRQHALNDGFLELAITSLHTIAAAALPPLHRDPFDRILISQAQIENLTFLSVDKKVLQYTGDIRSV